MISAGIISMLTVFIATNNIIINITITIINSYWKQFLGVFGLNSSYLILLGNS
jgi:hypothetical protein